MNELQNEGRELTKGTNSWVKPTKERGCCRKSRGRERWNRRDSRQSAKESKRNVANISINATSSRNASCWSVRNVNVKNVSAATTNPPLLLLSFSFSSPSFLHPSFRSPLLSFHPLQTLHSLSLLSFLFIRFTSLNTLLRSFRSFGREFYCCVSHASGHGKKGERKRECVRGKDSFWG